MGTPVKCKVCGIEFEYEEERVKGAAFMKLTKEEREELSTQRKVVYLTCPAGDTAKYVVVQGEVT